VIVLVADDLGPLPETIRSRCQLIPFRRLSDAAVRAVLEDRAPGLAEPELAAIARLAAGRLDRAESLLDPDARKRREALLAVARSVYAEDTFDAGAAADRVLSGIRSHGAAAKEEAERTLPELDLPKREAEQRLRRVQRRAERDELLASLEELAWWYRDLIAVAVGADDAIVHSDRIDDLQADGSRDRIVGAETACEIVRESWRAFEEFNLAPALAFEALLLRLRLVLRPAFAPA
jgi:DNA polymerase-3 subunit delta'